MSAGTCPDAVTREVGARGISETLTLELTRGRCGTKSNNASVGSLFQAVGLYANKSKSKNFSEVYWMAPNFEGTAKILWLSKGRGEAAREI